MIRLFLILVFCSSPLWGAIAGTNLTTSGDSTDLTVYTTASISPGADRLILAGVVSSKTTEPNEAVLTGNGLTWVAIAGTPFSTVATPLRKLTVYRAMGSSPSAGAVTITFGAGQTGCAWSIIEFAGVDTGGTNGSAAVVQVSTPATTDADVTIATSLSTFLTGSGAAAFTSTNTGGTPDITPEAGWTELGDQDQSSTDMQLESMWIASPDTSPTTTFGSTKAAMISVEIKALLATSPAAANSEEESE